VRSIDLYIPGQCWDARSRWSDMP